MKPAGVSLNSSNRELNAKYFFLIYAYFAQLRSIAAHRSQFEQFAIYKIVCCRYSSVSQIIHHCRSVNIREVLIFENFLRTKIIRENYYYKSATK